MATTNLHVHAGVFSCRQFGHIDVEDAQLFTHHLRIAAGESRLPIIARIDAREATLLKPDAGKILMKATAIPNLDAIVIVTGNLVMTQTSRLLAIRSRQRNIHVFESWEDAETFTNAQLTARVG